MRKTGKFLIWTAIILFVAFAICVALLLLEAQNTTGVSPAEATGWIIGLSFYISIPLGMICVILILTGTVLMTSGKRRAEIPHPSTDTPASAPASNLVVMMLRFVAIVLFSWWFFPAVMAHFQGFYRYADVPTITLIMVVAIEFMRAAFIPLCLWLVSNLIKMRTAAPDGQPA